MIEVLDDYEALSRAAAGLIAEQARQAVAARGRFCLALAGGSTPRRCYELLAEPPWREQVPWGAVQIFWGDERCVPGDDPRSNARMARAALLARVPLPPAQIHPMAGEEEPAAAAMAYEELLREFFLPDEPRFDLVLLGLGADGHTASLLPGTPAVLERERLVIPVQAPGEAFARLTLTLPVLNLARLALFLVSGREKAQMLRQVLVGPPERFPAQLIAPLYGEVHWLVDRAAAAPEAVWLS